MLPGDESLFAMRDSELKVPRHVQKAVDRYAAGVVAAEVDREAVVLVVDERPPKSWAVRLAPLSGIEEEIVSLDVQIVTEDGYLFGRIEYDVRHGIYPFVM